MEPFLYIFIILLHGSFLSIAGLFFDMSTRGIQQWVGEFSMIQWTGHSAKRLVQLPGLQAANA